MNDSSLHVYPEFMVDSGNKYPSKTASTSFSVIFVQFGTRSKA